MYMWVSDEWGVTLQRVPFDKKNLILNDSSLLPPIRLATWLIFKNTYYHNIQPTAKITAYWVLLFKDIHKKHDLIRVEIIRKFILKMVFKGICYENVTAKSFENLINDSLNRWFQNWCQGRVIISYTWTDSFKECP